MGNRTSDDNGDFGTQTLHKDPPESVTLTVTTFEWIFTHGHAEVAVTSSGETLTFVFLGIRGEKYTVLFQIPSRVTTTDSHEQLMTGVSFYTVLGEPYTKLSVKQRKAYTIDQTTDLFWNMEIALFKTDSDTNEVSVAALSVITGTTTNIPGVTP